MKTVPEKETFPEFLAGLLVAILFVVTTSSSFAFSRPPIVKNNVYYSILINKSLSSKKHKIKLYTDAKQELLLFSANSSKGKKYQLYIFDMDSKLVMKAIVCNRETAVLNNISKGNYLFQVFINDEQVENGELIIK